MGGEEYSFKCSQKPRWEGDSNQAETVDHTVAATLRIRTTSIVEQKKTVGRGFEPLSPLGHLLSRQAR